MVENKAHKANRAIKMSFDEPIITPSFKEVNSKNIVMYRGNRTSKKGRIKEEYPESPLTFAGTGIGYLRFTDTNGFLVPAAGNVDRPARPELGDSRWSTDRNILEVFAGTIESVTGIAVVTGLPNQLQSGLTGTTNGAVSGLLTGFRFLQS